jgi:hypothetical protein
MASRKGIRRRLGRRKRSRSRTEELTERTRLEARAIERRRRRAARRSLRAQAESLDELGMRLRGGAFETRRRLRPLAGPLGALLGRIAPFVSGALLFLVKLIAALIALALELVTVAVAWIADVGIGLGLALAAWARRTVTPLRTVAFVGGFAALALAASQFFDYHGVAVDAPNYAGEVGTVAPAPITGTASAGSAHVWILLPIAAVAFALVVGAYRGRTQLAVGVAVCGLVGIAVALAIDLPQGLDAGRPGLAFSGAQAELLEGFWAEISASAVLILCGLLMPLYSGERTRRGRRRSRTGRRRRPLADEDVGGLPPGLQAES